MRTGFGMRQWIGMLTAVAAFPTLAQEHFNFSTTTKYAGRAIALQITQGQVGANPTPVEVANSGSAPVTGGEVRNFLDDATPIPGVTAHQLDTVTLGANGENRSQASMTHLDARIGLHHITALWVESEATAAAEIGNVPARGKSILDGLTVDGQPTAVTGAVNQTITFPDGYLVINEQSGSSSPHFGSLTVNALHLFVMGAGNLVAASSKAEVIYAPMPNSPL
jgi:hypothetical protein